MADHASADVPHDAFHDKQNPTEAARLAARVQRFTEALEYLRTHVWELTHKTIYDTVVKALDGD